MTDATLESTRAPLRPGVDMTHRKLPTSHPAGHYYDDNDDDDYYDYSDYCCYYS